MTKREARICEVCDQPVEDNVVMKECEDCGDLFGNCCTAETNKNICVDCSIVL